jgi:single-stranded-DNA-specific exonuclease
MRSPVTRTASEVLHDWLPQDTDPGAVRRLASEMGIEPLLATILVNRSIFTKTEAAAFLQPSVDDLLDPFALADMDLAAERMARAITDHERILVYGDADVDGLTSTGLLVQFLRMLKLEPMVYVPNRAYEGYSFTPAGVEHVLASGAQLVVSVDNGISSIAPVATIQSAGIDVIITDHHMPADELPPALAVVNPKRVDCGYSFKGLAGVGVAFKLACAVASKLHRRLQLSDDMHRFLGESLSWVCMGTVSDMMPLRGENRVLVSRGLRALPRTNSPGLAALCHVSGIGQAADCRAEDIAFRLAPRLNAATRMGRSDLSVSLVTASDPNEAKRLAEALDEANKSRQIAERELLAELHPLLEDIPADQPVVLASQTWNAGLLGLVAGRITRERGVPAVLMSSAQGDPAKGSCRCMPGFDAHAALGACREHLTAYGGHPGAAGFSIPWDRIEAFREAFMAQWNQQSSASTGPAPHRYEAEVPLAGLTHKLIKALDGLEPFGKDNPRPVLVTGGLTVQETRRMGGDGQHLALTVACGDLFMRAVAFSRGHWADRLPVGLAVDVLHMPKFNNFRGRTTVEMELVDVRPARNH